MIVSEKLTLSAVQFDSIWQQSQLNIERALRLIGDSTSDLVVLPEMFATGFSMNSPLIAQAADGTIVTSMRQAAIDSGRAIIFSAATIEGGEFFNRLYFIHPTGKIESYDKRHLFRMAGEHDHYKAGTDRLIVQFKGWRICPLICYDLRFPVFSRGADQYDLLIYVASWPEARAYAWSTLLRARAIENQCYCLGVNRVGSDPKNTYSGDSVVLDFLGRPLVEATPSKSQMIDAELSLSDLRDFRASFAAHLDADQFEILR